MSHPEYDHYGTPPLKVIEECSELIMAISKAERFGYFNYHPDLPKSSNLDQIELEIADVKRVISSLEQYLTNLKTQLFNNKSEKVLYIKDTNEF